MNIVAKRDVLAFERGRPRIQRIQYHQYGGPEQMKIETTWLPTPAMGDVTVKVNFAAINPIDWKVRNGYLKMRKFNGKIAVAMG